MTGTPGEKYQRFVAGFLVVFLLSLANSIFLNQVGYYGALLVFLIYWARNKKNPFAASGLELFLFLFLVAETVSSFLSPEPAHSFHNLLKRALLIPLLYVIPAAASDEKKINLLFHGFLVFAVLTALIYLGFSYRFVVNKLYFRELSGPSVFQYPITTSEIFSFLFLLLLALSLDAGMERKKRLFYTAGLFIAGLALLATFKKTGFIGAGAGMLTVLWLQKFRKTVIALTALIAAFFLLNTSRNELICFHKANDGYFIAKQEHSPRSPAAARPYRDDMLLLASADSVLLYDKVWRKMSGEKFLAPVTSIHQANDTVWLAELIQSRWVPFSVADNSILRAAREFISPGKPVNASFNNRFIYFLDSDSGLTIRSIQSGEVTSRLPKFAAYEYIGTNDSVALFHTPGKAIEVWQMDNGIPSRVLARKIFAPDSLLFTRLLHGRILTFSETGYTVWDVRGDSLLYAAAMNCGQIIAYFASAEGAVMRNVKGEYILHAGQEIAGRKVRLQFNDDLPVNDIVIRGDSIIVARGKPGLAQRIFDPYHPSNLTRFSLWQTGMRIFRENPFFGVGDIDLYDYHALYKEPYQKEIQGHLHSNYFHMLATLGGFGFLSFLLLLCAIAFVLRGALRTARGTKFSAHIAGCIGIYVSFLVAGLTEWNFGDHEIITLVWFSVGMAVAVRRRLAKEAGTL